MWGLYLYLKILGSNSERGEERPWRIYGRPITRLRDPRPPGKGKCKLSFSERSPEEKEEWLLTKPNTRPAFSEHYPFSGEQPQGGLSISCNTESHGPGISGVQ
ncbi:hypothetical protein CapIbe_015624 [Capra ibex]